MVIKKVYNTIDIVLPPDIYDSHLKIIGGIQFTRREIDILACILNGKSAKKIASILTISPKTVVNHIRNIMLKMECNSQERIIDFLEKSDNYIFLKKYYLSLLVQLEFEDILKEISSQFKNQNSSCMLVYSIQEKDNLSLIALLNQHLKIAGLKTSMRIKEKSKDNSLPTKNILYCLSSAFLQFLQINEDTENSKVLSLIQINEINEFQNLFLLLDKNTNLIISKKNPDMICIDLTEHNNYYFLFLEILKRLSPTFELDTYVVAFKDRFERLINPVSLQRHSKNNNELLNKQIFDTFLNILNKKRMLIQSISAFSIIIICVLVFMFCTSQGNEYQKQLSKIKNLTETKTISLEAQLENGRAIDWNLPRQDHLFIGRTKFLEELHKTLDPKTTIWSIFRNIQSTIKENSNKNTLAICACAGLGGIGKTQLAIQYVHHTKHHYTLRAWFPAENLELLRQKYIQFAKMLGYSDEKISSETAIFYVNSWLANHPGSLLIFDNVSNYEAIAPFLPEKGSTVLITTRNQVWPEKIQVLPLNVMLEEEAIKLVQVLSKQEDHHINKLVEELGYLPLAIAQASAYIAYNKISVADYLNLYHNYQHDMLANPIFPEGIIHNAVDLTWNVSLEAIERQSINKEVRQLVRIFLTASSYLASENIPVIVLQNWLEKAYPNLKKAELLTRQMLVELQAYSLLHLNDQGQTFTMHRLVQSVMRNRHLISKLNDHNYPKLTAEWYELLFKAVNLEFRRKMQVLQDETRQKKLLPHLQSLTEYYDNLLPNLKPIPSLGEVFFNIGNVFLRVGAPKLAKPYYERALKIQEQNYGKNHPQVASTLTNLGETCRSLGGGQQAKVFLEGALEIFEQYYGKDDPQVVSTLSNLGCAYGTLGNDEQAKNVLERALKIVEYHYNKDDLRIAEILTKLGDIFASLGDANQSKDYLSRALNIKEQYYGKEHAELAMTLTNLGAAYSYLGDPKPAMAILERALKIQQQYYGKESRDVGITLNYLGRTYNYIEDPERARILLEQSLKILEKSEGTEDYYLSLILTNLGEAYTKLLDPKKATEILERALKIEEAFFKTPHPTTAITLLMLAKIHINLKEFTLAQPLAKRSYQILLRTYGKEHNYTNQALEALNKCSRPLAHC